MLSVSFILYRNQKTAYLNHSRSQGRGMPLEMRVVRWDSLGNTLI